jgi:hypothetical protein
MTDFILYAAAALGLPIGSVIIAHFVLWQQDRDLARIDAKAGSRKHPGR